MVSSCKVNGIGEDQVQFIVIIIWLTLITTGLKSRVVLRI